MTIHLTNEAQGTLELPFEKIANDIIQEALDSYHCPYEATVEIMLTDNDAIQDINCTNRGIDSPTDVLSFPMLEYSTPADFSFLEQTQEGFDLDTGELVLGDIVISLEKVKEQALAYNHSTTREFAFLIAHSMLHLFGFDHIDDEEREDMEQRQEKILTAKGYIRK